MKAYALVGGPKQEWPKDIQKILISAKSAGNLIIGVDRGSFLLTELNVQPDLAIGDFDSLKHDELTYIEKIANDIRFAPTIKNLTDTELMIQTAFCDYHVSSLCILGATGGRIDHFLVNLMMLLNPKIRKFADKVSILDKQNLIKFMNPGKKVFDKEDDFSYFGISALTAIKDLNIWDARYNLADYSSDYPVTFSSNEFLKNKNYFKLSFKKGLVAVIYSKDINRFYKLN